MATSPGVLSTKPVAWITGAHGLIGTQLLRLAPDLAPHYRVRGLTRADFDLLDFAAIEREFLRDQPQLVIHCAGVTIVADAHQDPARARRSNVELPAFLAGLAADRAFIHFSTDLVFDGRQGNYLETDAVNPLTVYGETKAESERRVLANPRHTVVRTSINAGVSRRGDRTFNEQFRRALNAAGVGMKLFVDEFRCPIAAAETARAVWELANARAAGIWHVAGAKRLSRYEIARLLVPRWPEVTAEIQAGSAKDFPGPPRALDTSMNIGKVQAVLSRPLPGFDEWLAEHPQELV